MIYSYNTAIGRIYIRTDDKNILEVSLNRIDGEIQETPLIMRAYNQLEEYFEGKRKTFGLPLAPEGTAFQKKVWKALTQIPYGKTANYKDIALSVGNKKACRAVGMANNKNPIIIIIPCHRVIGANGGLRGYAYGLDIKKQLLDLEEAHTKSI